MSPLLPIDRAAAHALSCDGTRVTVVSTHTRSRLHDALVAHVRARVDGGAVVASVGDVDVGVFVDGAWQPRTVLSALELRFLADRAVPHPGVVPALASHVALQVRTDLHTHFAGCVDGDTLVALGAAHHVVYPAALLKEAGVAVDVDVDLHDLGDADDPVRSALARGLSLPLDRQSTHKDMDRVYRLRRPLTKQRALFVPLLRAIAQDYARMGVRYVELSLFDILEPDVLAAAHAWVPRLRAETGVDLRFLAAFSRHDDLEWDLDLIDRLRAYAGSDVIVGVDFMGHETNSTHAFLPALEAVARFARDERPGFVVRVHAGENAGHPENVRAAVDCLKREGAGHGVNARIGHGLFGVDDDALAVMADASVVVEFNVDSNFALNNVSDALAVPLRHVVDAGVAVVLGTDGYGIYGGDSNSALRGALLSGLAVDDVTGVVARAEAAVVSARAEIDKRWSRGPAFVVPHTLPPPRHFTPAVALARRAATADARAQLTQAVAAIGAVFVDDADGAAFAARLAGRTPLAIGGAWRSAWARLTEAEQRDATGVVDAVVHAAARARAVIVTGGTRHGVEGAVHAAAAAAGIDVIGAIVDATPVADLDARVSAFVVVGASLYDKGCGLFRVVEAHGGAALFVGGGPIVHDDIRIAINLRLPRALCATVPGAAQDAARRYPKDAFRGDSDDVDDVVARLVGTRVRAAARGGALYFRGRNPTADAVCLRRSPRAPRSWEVLLVQRGKDVATAFGRWALPGGFVKSSAARGGVFVDDVESPADAALRELCEEAGLELRGRGLTPRALGVYQGGGRDARDSVDAFVQSHAFLLVLPPDVAAHAAVAGDDADNVAWFAVDALPPLAFDHAQIVADACALVGASLSASVTATSA